MPPPFYKWKKPQILFGMWDVQKKKRKKGIRHDENVRN